MIIKYVVNWAISVASYGALGHVQTSTSNCLFLGHFRAAQTLNFWVIRLHVVAYPVKNIQACSFVTVYCMNFVIFLCVTLKLFFVSFVPLLTPNPGDATELGPLLFVVLLQVKPCWSTRLSKLLVSRADDADRITGNDVAARRFVWLRYSARLTTVKAHHSGTRHMQHG